MNRFWGGPVRGYTLVNDSNYDWGQGLVELRAWARERDLAHLAVWYFGTDPGVSNAPLQRLALHGMDLRTAADVRNAVEGRCLAVSTTILYGVDPEIEAYRVAAEFLRARPADGRTTTFFLYDFTEDARHAAPFASCQSHDSS